MNFLINQINFFRYQYLILFLFLLISCMERDITNPVDPRYTLNKPQLNAVYSKTPNNLTLEWQNIDGNPKVFNIYRKSDVDDGFTLIKIVEGTTNSYTDLDVEKNIYYSYYIVADWYGRISEPSNIIVSGISETFQRNYFSEAMFQYVQTTSDGGLFMFGENVQLWLLKTDIYGNQQWSKKYDTGTAFSAQQTSDGGFILLGRTSDQYILIKVSGKGNVEWKKHFQFGSEQSTGSVRQTNDGGYILLLDRGSVNNWGRAKNIYLIKTDAQGNIQIEKNIGDFNSRGVLSGSVRQTNDGGYILDATIFNGKDIYVRKVDTKLNTEWEKTFSTSSETDWGLTIEEFDNGGYLIGVARNSYNLPQYGYQEIIKINEIGEKEWQTGVVGSGAIRHLVILENGEFASIGSNFQLNRYDNNGNILWTKVYRGLDVSVGRGICKMPDDGFSIVGQTYTEPIYNRNQGEALLIRVDSYGNQKQ